MALVSRTCVVDLMFVCVICTYVESEGDFESGATSKESGDAHIVDVTSQFVGSRGITDTSTRDGSSDAECCPSPESVPDAPCSQQTDSEDARLTEVVGSIRIEDRIAAAGLPDVEVAVVIGGMDTGGEIFDDCLVFRLTTKT